MAILMAGAAYCPLTPEEPQARLEFLTQECRAACTLVHTNTKNHLPNNKCVDLGPIISQALSHHDRRANQTNKAVLPQLNNSSRAIIMFTSGSTGKPKAMQISHANFVHSIIGVRLAELIAENDIILQRTPVTFDMHLQDIIGSLMVGACLVAIPPGGDRDLNYISAALERYQVTCLSTVPTVFSALVEFEPALKRKLSTCRILLSSGT